MYGKTDTFTYTLCQQSGCDPSTATVTVTGVCTCPVANGDSATASPGTAVIIDVLNNDQDKDGATICNVESPTDNGGTAVLKGNKITYTAPVDFCGKTDTFTYSLCKTGCTPSTATVTVKGDCVCPVAKDDSATTYPGTAVTIDVLNNDQNKDGATICNVESQTDNGGTAIISGNQILYTPNAGFCGPDTFTYSLCKTGCGQPTTATVAVTVVCCPKPMDDIANTFQGSPVTIDVLSNDLNKDEATICNVQAVTTYGGTAVISDNRITYTPKAGYCGPDTFTYSLCKTGCGQSETATVTVTVVCCPVAIDDLEPLSPSMSVVTIDVLDNDQNKDGATICNVQSPTAKGGTAVLENNEIIYTPPADFCGKTDTFTYLMQGKLLSVYGNRYGYK
jgi:Bacterial Ig domain